MKIFCFPRAGVRFLLMELYKELVFYGSQTVQLSEVPPYQMSLNQQTNAGDVAEGRTVGTRSRTQSHTLGGYSVCTVYVEI